MSNPQDNQQNLDQISSLNGRLLFSGTKIEGIERSNPVQPGHDILLYLENGRRFN
jgi:hypothetical protein